jgi:hypothetical protein
MLDIVQNSIRAGAGLTEVTLAISADRTLTMMVTDDGKGMDADQLKRVKDPFFSTRLTRKVGLGVSLLTQKAEQSGGYLTIESMPGEGTILKAVFQSEHPDCPPLGDFPGCAWMLMASNPSMRMIFKFTSTDEEWEWDSDAINEILDGVTVADGQIRQAIMDWFNADFAKFKEYIKSN